MLNIKELCYNEEMRRKLFSLAIALLIGVASLFPANTFAAKCNKNTPFFGLKSWYAYLETTDGKSSTGRETCEISQKNFEGDKLISSVWKIVLTVLNDLFFVAGFLAVILIAYSGFKYVTSAGNPGATEAAKKTLTGTIVGFVIVILAQVIVNTVLAMMNTGGGF